MKKLTIIAVVTVLVIIFCLSIYGIYITSQQEHEHQKNLSKLKERIAQLEKYKDESDGYRFPYPIYYINMDKDYKRRQHMERQLQGISTDFTRIRGVNGRKITNKNQDEIEGQQFFNFYDDMTEPEIGCTLSHLLAIRKARQDNRDVVMICEDDMAFSTCYLIPPLEDIVAKAPADWEILQLFTGGLTPQDEKKIRPLPNVDYVKRSYPKNSYWSCLCYLINRKGMDKILAVTDRQYPAVSINPVKNDEPFPYYGLADFYIYDLTMTYSIFPNLFFPNNTELDSTIHTDHTFIHVESTLLALDKLMGN